MTKPEPLPPLGLAVAGRRLGSNELVWEPNVEPDLAGYRLLRVRSNAEPEVVATLPSDQTRASDADYKRMRLVLTSAHRKLHNEMHRRGRGHGHLPAVLG